MAKKKPCLHVFNGEHTVEFSMLNLALWGDSSEIAETICVSAFCWTCCKALGRSEWEAIIGSHKDHVDVPDSQGDIAAFIKNYMLKNMTEAEIHALQAALVEAEG